MQGFTFAASGSVQRASQVYEKSANRPAPAGLGSWDFYSKSARVRAVRTLPACTREHDSAQDVVFRKTSDHPLQTAKESQKNEKNTEKLSQQTDVPYCNPWRHALL